MENYSNWLTTTDSILTFTHSYSSITDVNIVMTTLVDGYTLSDIGGTLVKKRRKRLTWAEWEMFKFLAEDDEDHQCYNCFYFSPKFSGCREGKVVVSPLGWCPWWMWQGHNGRSVSGHL